MIGQRFREILYFWWRHLGPLFLVTAPFALLNEAIQWWLGTSLALPEQEQGQLQFNLASLSLILLLRPLAEGAVVVQLSRIQHGKPASLVHCLAPALLGYPALLATYFLIGLGVSLGWMALFFPALWVYTRLCFAPFEVLLHRRSPIDALRHSFAMTQAQQWPLLLIIVLTFLTTLLLSGILSTLAIEALGEGASTTLLVALPVSLISALMNVAAFRFWNLSQAPA